jgi:subtilisin family serine protease
MPKYHKGDKSSNPKGNYITINGKRRELSHHPGDFSVITGRSKAKKKYYGVKRRLPKSPDAYVWPINQTTRRVSAESEVRRDELMRQMREKKRVAHHIYHFNETGEELLIRDRIFLTLREDNPAAVEEIRKQYKLSSQGRSGRAYIFKVTEATGSNPLKTANEIAERPEVEACIPELLVPMQSGSLCAAALPALPTLAAACKLFAEQWYLTTDFIPNGQNNILKSASIQAREAWELAGAGKPEIVIAVIDDGFDIPKPNETLAHPVFKNKLIHPDKRDFSGINDFDTSSGGGDFHGTPVASIATGSSDGGGMFGVAPCCTLLPLRIEFGTLQMLLDALVHASSRADVVNCSITLRPSSEEFLLSHPTFLDQVKGLISDGGRRPGKGLVIVFSAGNNDAPTYLSAEQNSKGVKFIINTGPTKEFSEIESGNVVHTGFPEIDRVVVVGAMSSLKRKAGYSNWGKHLTVTAPSDNNHGIKEDRSIVPAGILPLFDFDYPGAGLVAALNREGDHGARVHQEIANINIPGFTARDYTRNFGGTSGAAAIVTGVVALMLSANPNLSAEQVIDILKSTADTDLDFTLDPPGDPNLQDFTGGFVGGRSHFFGAGKVNAFKAVKKARETQGQ